MDGLTQIVAKFLERTSADYPPEYLSLHSLLPACATQLFSRLFDTLRLALPAFARSFHRYLKILCAYAHLVSFAGRRRSSGVLRRDWLDCRSSKAGGPAWLAGTTASSILRLYVHPGAASGRTSPIAILVNAFLAGLNGLWLLAPAAALGDLANMIDTSLAKTSDVLFEARWMEASGFRSLDGVFGVVGGLCKALSECVYGSNVGDVPPGEV